MAEFFRNLPLSFFLLKFPILCWHYPISLSKCSLVPATKPFVGLRGPDPGSEVKVCQQTPILLALSGVTCLRRSKSHLKQYGWVLELGFRTLREDR